MLTACIDITLYLSQFLADKDKISLSAISKKLNMLKYEYRYRDRIEVAHIYNLKYFNNFEVVEIKDARDRVPRHAEYIYFTPTGTKIPSNVTHLYFYYQLPLSLRVNIPSSVTHLTFGSCFDAKIYPTIPLSVTHLTFNFGIRKLSAGYIPSSVTHLKFGLYYSDSIMKCIPSSVTHLKFGRRFHRQILEIPSSIVEMTVSNKYEHQISDKINVKITIKDSDF
jgi:hypothetical protein